MAASVVADTVVLHSAPSRRIRRKTYFVMKSALRIWDKHYLECFVKHLGIPRRAPEIQENHEHYQT
jgi:hypothetical protein